MSLNVAEICEKLELTDRRAKISTLKILQQKCFDTEYTSDSMVLQIFDELYLHILKCYSDKFESVRDEAIQTVGMFIERLPPNEFHLVNIVSTLVERMGQEETVEESEEIRLAIMQQLVNLQNRFIRTGGENSLRDCYKDIIKITLKAFKDSYPAVQREACACVSALAASADTYIFRPFAESLAKGVYGILNHKHSQCRIAAVRTLAYIALHINASGDALSQLIMEVSPLLMDSMPLVRRECGELGVRLLLELRDRYSYFERLIPLVLCCLKDDSPEVQAYILPLWEKCGNQYYDENETELSKQEIADLASPNYPPNIKRPTIGCRGIVQRSIRILNLIMRESNDWKENVRLHSVKLLYQFVLHAEAAMTAKFFEIYGDVARALTDSEPAVVHEAVKVANLMGCLLNYDDWIDHGFEGLEKNAKLGYLKCFYYMYMSSAPVKYEHNVRLSIMLKQPQYSQTLNSNYQLYILKMIEMILDKNNLEENQADCIDHYRNCYCSVIKVISLSLATDDCDELQRKGSNILLRICSACNCNVDDVHEQYFMDALEFVENIDAPLEAISEPILLLYGLIKLAKFRTPYLEQLQQSINTVFQNCADESKIKIFSAVSVAMLDWNKTIRRSLTESCDFLKAFLHSVVEPHLIWQAGANAEAMRSLAAATLCALSQGAAQEASQVLPYFAKYIPSLLEDQSVSTRHYSIKCLYNFGAIDIEHLKPIAYGCLQRINDPSSEIRILAASVIPKLQLKLNNSNKSESENSKLYTHENDIWLSFIKHCFDILYLHYNNPEERLREVIKDTLIELTNRYPKISQDSYERTLVATHNCFNLIELKTQLPLI